LFGAPCTSTSVDWPGADCTIAPARRAASIASLRGRLRKPVNESRTPSSYLIVPFACSFGACRNALISSPAAS
jgi:hypothetical protein